MSWSIGYDSNWQRDIGYGVPAYCDHPKCNKEIHRGLAHVCGEEPRGGECGCGLYFCDDHLTAASPQRCPKCARYDHKPYKPKPDHPDWIAHKLTHESWIGWRYDHPEEVAKLSAESSGNKRAGEVT